MKGRAKTSDLRRIVMNSRQYAVRSGSVSGATLWIRGATNLRVVSTDDFMILVDQANLDDQFPPEMAVMSHDALEKLHRTLEKEKEDFFDFINLDFTEDIMTQEVLYEADMAVFEVDHFDTVPATGFAIAPARLRKLNLVKPGNNPVDLKAFQHPEGGVIVGFRIGPTVRGLIAPLDREKLSVELAEESLWLD